MWGVKVPTADEFAVCSNLERVEESNEIDFHHTWGGVLRNPSRLGANNGILLRRVKKHGR